MFHADVVQKFKTHIRTNFFPKIEPFMR